MTRFLKNAYILAVFLFLYSPLVVIAVFSFNRSKHSMAWKGFTTMWYTKLFHNDSLLIAAYHSLTIAAASATLSLVLGTMAAFLLHRRRIPGRQAFLGIMFAMMMTPDIVIGISLLVLYLIVHWPLGFWTLLLAHVTLCAPFVTVTVHARLKSIRPSLLESAQDLGAPEYQVFRRIIVPLAAPALAAGWLLSFTLSLDDVLISFFTTGPTYDVLPLRIYSMVRMGVKPDVNALCVVVIVFTVTAVALARRILKEKI